MKFIKLYICTVFLVSLFVGIVSADQLENKLTSYISNLANNFGNSVSNIISENDRVKYLDINLGVQEHMKPTVSLTNVNKIAEYKDSILFNQNSLNIYDDDQTINLGIGHRTLLNDDKVIVGANAFFDYAFDNAHQRYGAGLEVISSVFDLRSNIYDASSGVETVATGATEEALDGWDLRLDYHLPLEIETRVFAGMFDFENDSGSFEVKGEKYGLNLFSNNFDVELGYTDDNKTGDGVFANMHYVIPLGDNRNNSNRASGYLDFVSVAERMYEPVKRENKIRVVKTSLNVTASGY